ARAAAAEGVPALTGRDGAVRSTGQRSVEIDRRRRNPTPNGPPAFGASLAPRRSGGRMTNANKRLVVCSDGTWNDFLNGTVTNVVKFARAVKQHDGDGLPQVVYYHSGVGTGSNVVDRLLGGAAGPGTSAKTRDPAHFVGENHAPGAELES